MLNVLIIDDEESIRDSLSIHLASLGYSIETVSHPFECTCVQQGACQMGAPFVDVVIVDQTMPFMTGLEFFSGRQKRGCKGLNQRLAIMSANLSGDEILYAKELGCRIFIKPFKLHELEQWLAEIQASRNLSSE